MMTANKSTNEKMNVTNSPAKVVCYTSRLIGYWPRIEEEHTESRRNNIPK
jgi:hypothetical protein